MRLRAKHKKISRATIYRTLDLIVDSGIVGRLRIGETGYRYERLRAGEHHDHLICNECGRSSSSSSRASSAPGRRRRAPRLCAALPQPSDAGHLPPAGPAPKSLDAVRRLRGRVGRGCAVVCFQVRELSGAPGATTAPHGARRVRLGVTNLARLSRRIRVKLSAPRRSCAALPHRGGEAQRDEGLRGEAAVGRGKLAVPARAAGTWPRENARQNPRGASGGRIAMELGT